VRAIILLLSFTVASVACDVEHFNYQPEVAGRIPDAVLHDTTCVAGMAGGFPCSNVDLVDRLPISAFAVAGLPLPATASMLWGYTDEQTGKEYALLGMNNSLAIVLLDGPGGHAQLIGRLPTHTGNSIWRDVRTYRDYAFITSDSNGAHGMQVLDLRQLRSISNPPIEFTETAHYAGQGLRNTHTIAINEATGYAYLAGTNTCAGGIHMVDIRNPIAPTFAGCFSQDGYTHETQCWNYQGPDTEHVGKELCLAADVDALVAIDVSNKAAPPIQLSSITYAGVGYVHQAWFTPDFRYALLDDETDEQNSGNNGKTYVFDYSNIDAPVLKGAFVHPRRAIDHNLYIKNNFVFESNYTSGLRILSLTNLAAAQMTEVGYFDIYPSNDGATFNGNWGNYPFFASGRVALSGIAEGLFIVRPNICAPPAAPTTLSVTAPAANQVNIAWAPLAGTQYRVQRAIGGCGISAGPFETIASGISSGSFLDASASGSTLLGYRVQTNDSANTCPVSADSACVEITPSGSCTAPPRFNGLTAAASALTPNCAVDLSWIAANSSCANSTLYNIYRSSDALFAPNAANLVATVGRATGTRVAAPNRNLLNYIVRAKDAVSGNEETNQFLLSAAATGSVSDGAFLTGAEIGDPILTEGVASLPEAALGSVPNSREHVGWHINTIQAHTGLRSYESTIGSNYCLSIETPTLGLSAGQTSVFSFWTKHGLPSGGRDGGSLEMSINGGPWIPATFTGALPGAITQAGNACGLPIGRAIFNGTQNSWGQFSVDLSTQAGNQVRFRFLLATGSSVATGLLGWLIDDVELSHAQLPSTCNALEPDAFLRDGFEG
jgi:choice-of-anchor B domain-containing protein